MALTDIRKDLVERESRNTISIKVQGDRSQVWLNGEEIGVIRAAGPAKGKIGLYIEKHPASNSGQFSVREVQIQKLAEPEEK